MGNAHRSHLNQDKAVIGFSESIMTIEERTSSTADDIKDTVYIHRIVEVHMSEEDHGTGGGLD